MKKKNVLIVSAFSVIRGGVEMFLMKWIIHASQEYNFIWYHPLISNNSTVEAEFRRLGVKFISGNMQPESKCSKGIVHLVYRWIKQLYKINCDIKHIVNNQQFDIVHVNATNLWITIIALRQAKRVGINCRISHSHSSAIAAYSSMKKLIYHILREILNNYVTRRAACSKQAAIDTYGKHYLWQTIIVHNCIDAQKYAFSLETRDECRKKLSLQNCFVIGHIGRLSAEKNQKFMLDVFKCMCEKNANARLLIVGDGLLGDYLKIYANSLEVEDKVIFVGLTDMPQYYYPAMDLFILPSLYEGFPITAIEAQTSGLPCVFSENVTKEANIANHSLFLSLNQSTEEWAERILAFMQTANINREAAWRNTVEAGYDVSCMHQFVRQLYD